MCACDDDESRLGGDWTVGGDSGHVLSPRDTHAGCTQATRVYFRRRDALRAKASPHQKHNQNNKRQRQRQRQRRKQQPHRSPNTFIYIYSTQHVAHGLSVCPRGGSGIINGGVNLIIINRSGRPGHCRRDPSPSPRSHKFSPGVPCVLSRP